MTSNSQTEAALDEFLAHALSTDPSFAAWFLAQTPFAGRADRCAVCRSNNPWSRVELEVVNKLTGLPEMLVKECETDVLAIFSADGDHILALHIENKLANGKFTPHQPELYAARKDQWKGRPKLGTYTDARTVLIAPRVFQARFAEECAKFDAYVSHEQIGEWLPAFRSSPADADRS